MHPNPAFRTTEIAQNIEFARKRGFGTLAINAPDGPLISHIPFLLSEDGSYADFHLVRSNPITRALPTQAVIAVSGADSYISPDWYEVDDQVPTWNYVAVHLRGKVTAQPQDTLRDLLDRQSEQNEALFLPKVPWTADKMTPDVLTRMMRSIVPCQLQIEGIQGTWKLGQNKDDVVRENAANHLEQVEHLQAATPVHRLMRNHK